MNDAGIPPTHQIQKTGHKNVQSINKYSKLNDNQQAAISDIVANNLPSRPTPVNLPCIKSSSYPTSYPALTDSLSTLSSSSTYQIMSAPRAIYPAPSSTSVTPSESFIHAYQSNESVSVPPAPIHTLNLLTHATIHGNVHITMQNPTHTKTQTSETSVQCRLSPTVNQL